MGLSSRANVINFFASLSMVRPNKLELLLLANLQVRKGAYPIGSAFRVGYLPYLKIETRLERPARGNHSSLFGPMVNYDRKSLTKFAPGCRP
jgi:hypothetical protein